jgi:hypothetical protein
MELGAAADVIEVVVRIEEPSDGFAGEAPRELGSEELPMLDAERIEDGERVARVDDEASVDAVAEGVDGTGDGLEGVGLVELRLEVVGDDGLLEHPDADGAERRYEDDGEDLDEEDRQDRNGPSAEGAGGHDAANMRPRNAVT